MCCFLIPGPSIKQSTFFNHCSTDKYVFYTIIDTHFGPQTLIIVNWHLRKGLTQFEINCCHCILKIRLPWNMHQCTRVSWNPSVWKNGGHLCATRNSDNGLSLLVLYKNELGASVFWVKFSLNNGLLSWKECFELQVLLNLLTAMKYPLTSSELILFIWKEQFPA